MLLRNTFWNRIFNNVLLLTLCFIRYNSISKFIKTKTKKILSPLLSTTYLTSKVTKLHLPFITTYNNR
jgi:hypothetical protein